MKSEKRTQANIIVKEFPKTGAKPLGRALFERFPLLYKDEEDARGSIRSARGARGKRNRKNMKEEDVKHFPHSVSNPYNLPEQIESEFQPLVITTKKKVEVGILSDIHFPYQDNKALTLAIDELKRRDVGIIILNGDIMDCYMISRFNRKPDKPGMLHEVAVTKNFLSTLRAEFPKTRIIYKTGNHEDRYKDFLYSHAPQLFGFEVFSLDTLLSLKDHNIEFVDDKRVIELGMLSVVHGHEFAKAVISPVNPARGFYLKAKKSVIGGHHHQPSSHSEKNISGNQQIASSTGCLCSLTPEYMPINNHSHGFATVTLYPNGEFDIHNMKILNNKIVNA